MRLAFVLERACGFFAYAGGVVLFAVILMAVGSVLGRAFADKPLLGDYEIVQFFIAPCVAWFLPICQLRRANIIVDFFTSWASQRTASVLDALGALAVATTYGIFAVQTMWGAVSAKNSGEVSMIVGLPIWVPYAAMVPSMVLAAAVALQGAWSDLVDQRK